MATPTSSSPACAAIFSIAIAAMAPSKTSLKSRHPQRALVRRRGWFDYDGDGRLDSSSSLRQLGSRTEPACVEPRSGKRAHWSSPHVHRPAHTLYRNNGDGTFTDVSEPPASQPHRQRHERRVRRLRWRWAHRHLRHQRREPNFLFHNDGNGRFTETAVRPASPSRRWPALSSMGVDFRDIDNDGAPTCSSRPRNETYPLYRNLGKGLFADFTYRSRVGAATSRHRLGGRHCRLQ